LNPVSLGFAKTANLFFSEPLVLDFNILYHKSRNYIEIESLSRKNNIFLWYFLPLNKTCPPPTESQVRGFAPIGRLEFWNSGIMGSGLQLRFQPIGLQAGG